MIKKTRLYLGLSLLVQAVTCLAVFIAVFTKSKKKSVSAILLALAAAGAAAGAYLVFSHMKDDYTASTSFDFSNDDFDMLYDEEDYPEEESIEIPVDDNVTEEEFK